MRLLLSAFLNFGSLVREESASTLICRGKRSSVVFEKLNFLVKKFFLGHPTFLLLAMAGLDGDHLLGVALLIFVDTSQALGEFIDSSFELSLFRFTISSSQSSLISKSVLLHQLIFEAQDLQPSTFGGTFQSGKTTQIQLCFLHIINEMLRNELVKIGRKIWFVLNFVDVIKNFGYLLITFAGKFKKGNHFSLVFKFRNLSFSICSLRFILESRGFSFAQNQVSLNHDRSVQSPFCFAQMLQPLCFFVGKLFQLFAVKVQQFFRWRQPPIKVENFHPSCKMSFLTFQLSLMLYLTLFLTFNCCIRVFSNVGKLCETLFMLWTGI